MINVIGTSVCALVSEVNSHLLGLRLIMWPSIGMLYRALGIWLRTASTGLARVVSLRLLSASPPDAHDCRRSAKHFGPCVGQVAF